MCHIKISIVRNTRQQQGTIRKQYGMRISPPPGFPRTAPADISHYKFPRDYSKIGPKTMQNSPQFKITAKIIPRNNIAQNDRTSPMATRTPPDLANKTTSSNKSRQKIQLPVQHNNHLSYCRTNLKACPRSQ